MKDAKRKTSPVLRRILLAVIGLILGVNVYFANASGIGGNHLPMPFGYGIANVLSGSMEPTFSKGTLLLVKEEKQAEPGQIVVYQSGQELIVHRVIQIEGNLVTTKGDANEAADPAFDASQIKGVVVGWIPFLGSWVSFLKTPAGIILLLVCAVLLMEGSFRKQKVSDDQQLEGIKEEIRRLKEEMNQEEPKKDMNQEEPKKDMQQEEPKKDMQQDEAKKVMQQNESKKTIQQEESKKDMLQDKIIKTEITQESKNRKEREDGEGKQNN